MPLPEVTLPAAETFPPLPAMGFPDLGTSPILYGMHTPLAGFALAALSFAR